MKQSEKLSAVCYDEINLSDLGDLDIKYDLFIKPANEANMFFVRSLTNEKLKMPVYTIHNSAYDKATFMDILLELATGCPDANEPCIE